MEDQIYPPPLFFFLTWFSVRIVGKGTQHMLHAGLRMQEGVSLPGSKAELCWLPSVRPWQLNLCVSVLWGFFSFFFAVCFLRQDLILSVNMDSTCVWDFQGFQLSQLPVFGLYEFVTFSVVSFLPSFMAVISSHMLCQRWHSLCVSSVLRMTCPPFYIMEHISWERGWLVTSALWPSNKKL